MSVTPEVNWSEMVKAWRHEQTRADRLQLANAATLETLRALLDEAEDVFVCMADATGIDRHNFPAPFVAARAAITQATQDQGGGE